MTQRKVSKLCRVGEWQSLAANLGGLTPECGFLTNPLLLETGEQACTKCRVPFRYLLTKLEKRKPEQERELQRNQLDGSWEGPKLTLDSPA